MPDFKLRFYLNAICKKIILNFHCLFELLPFVMNSLYSDENDVIIAWSNAFQML